MKLVGAAFATSVAVSTMSWSAGTRGVEMSNKGRGVVQPTSFAAKTHRQDIDGLRGVAVAGVVAYHFGLGVPGGYGGVDVFFVISGFLIAGIIKSELETGTFSLANFYVRRIRRILPALTVCVLATAIAASFFLFPLDFKDYGKSLKAAALSISNFYFMNTKGYFDSEATDKPLMHMWSLGVEEQFYIVFPLTLLLLFRYAPKRILPVLWIIVASSLAYSCYGVAKNPNTAFFSTAGRAWELGIGALLAFGALPRLRTSGLVEAEAVIGALLIAVCFITYTDNTVFPGPAALPLCLGAALIIHAGTPFQKTAVGSMLSSRPFVGLGLISYSVYLWHWPLLVFGLYRFPSIFAGDASHQAFVALVAASIALGALSWAFVEQPFRRMRNLPQSAAFISGGAAVLLVVAMASVVTSRPNWLQNWPPAIKDMQFARVIDPEKRGLAHAAGWPDGTFIVGARGRAPETVIWSDSYGLALLPGFISHHKKTGQGTVVAARVGCPPIVDLALRQKTESKRKCEHHNAEVFDAILQHSAKRVIIIGFWSALTKTRAHSSVGRVEYHPDGPIKGSALEAALRSMIEKLTARGKEVVFVGPVPVQKFYVAPAIARHIAWNDPLPPELSRTGFFKEEANLLGIFDRIASLPHVRVVYPHKSLCSAVSCDYFEGNAPFYSDYNHLAPAGVDRLNGMFAQMFVTAMR